MYELRNAASSQCISWAVCACMQAGLAVFNVLGNLQHPVLDHARRSVLAANFKGAVARWEATCMSFTNALNRLYLSTCTERILAICISWQSGCQFLEPAI